MCIRDRTYRFGVRYKSGGLYVNNQQINEVGLNFGFGIPLAGISSANLGFEIGQRGTNKASLIKENFFSIRIGVSLNDLWFVRSMYNGYYERIRFSRDFLSFI